MNWWKRKWLAFLLWLTEDDLATVEGQLLAHCQGPLSGFELAQWEAEELRLRRMRNGLRQEIAVLNARIEALR